MDKDNIESVSKALTAMIPYFGGAITSVWSDIQLARKRERFKEFIKELKNDIEGHKERIIEDFVSKEDFLDLFEQASKYITSERSKEKRKAFKNILINGCIQPDGDYDDVESYYRILDSMSEKDLKVLLVFTTPEQINYNNSHINAMWNKKTWIGSGHNSRVISEKLTPLSRVQVLESIFLLEQQGLINYRPNKPSSTLEAFLTSLTDKGKSFIKFISQN